MTTPNKMTGEEFGLYLIQGNDPLKNFVVPTNPSEPQLEVNGAVDLGGVQIPGSCVAYGVIFHGHVDLGSTLIKGTLDLTACVFEEGLRLDDTEIEGSLRLAGVTVLKDASWTNTDRHVLRLVGAIVKGRLDLANANIVGNLALFDGEINGFLDLRGLKAEKVLLRGLTIKGDLRLGCGRGGSKELSHIREINAPGIEVFGRVMVQGIGDAKANLENKNNQASGRHAPYLLMPNARIHGSVLVAPYFEGEESQGIDFQTSFPGDDWRIVKFVSPALNYVNFSGATIGGDVIVVCGTILNFLDFSEARIMGYVKIGWRLDAHPQAEFKQLLRIAVKEISTARARIEGFLFVVAAKISGDVDMNSMICHGIIDFENYDSHRTEIGGCLNLAGFRCLSHLHLYGVIVGKSLSMVSAESGTVRFFVAKDKKDNKKTDSTDITFFPCQIGHVLIANTKIRGDLDLSHIQVFGTPCIGKSGLEMVHTTVAGAFKLWSPDEFRNEEDGELSHSLIKPWNFSAAIVGDLRINRCKIEGDCVLTFAKVSGTIDLSDSVIDGDLNASSTITYEAPGDNQNILNEIKLLDPCKSAYRLTCRQLEMRMLCCNNDIDLTGLTIVANPAEVKAKTGLGSLLAPYLQVKGYLKAYHKEEKPLQGKEPREAYAEIPGCMNLSDSKATRIIVSAHGFSRPDCSEPEETNCDVDGILFVRAKLGMLEIPDISKYQFPKPIDLEDIEVGVWQIGKSSKGMSDREYSRNYKEFLVNADFRRSTYKSVEANLRNSGNEVPADMIYRTMMNREWKEYTPSFFRSFWEWVLGYRFFRFFWKWMLGYGTNATPLWVLISALALVSFPVYLNPKNFESSLALLAAQPDSFIGDAPIHNGSPPLKEWGWGDAIVIAAHYHIPVVPLVVRSEWDAKDGKGVVYGGNTKCSNPNNDPVVLCAQHEDAKQPNLKQPYFKVNLFAAEDYVTFIQLINWMFWPLLLTYIIRKLLRQ